jgi:geranylgeranyl reductase
MTGGRLAGEAVQEALVTGNPKALSRARKRFLRSHGSIFWWLGVMQRFWYTSDRRRERFVAICEDPDVQELTFESYKHKKMVRPSNPLTHTRIFFKNVRHLTGLAAV